MRQPLATRLLLVAAALDGVLALLPTSPQDQTRRAIASIKNAIEDARSGDKKNNKECRFYVDYLLPLPPETRGEDVDPWPGGLAQMYPYAENVVKEILQGVVDEPDGPCSSQVLSAADCCGFFVQESKSSPKNDVAAILFPGVDQLDSIEQVNQMVGPRTLILFNKQFQRPADFGFSQQEKSKRIIFYPFSFGFAFQEFACRGEDTKLIFEFPHWQSCVVCDEDVELGRREIPLLPPLRERPAYEALEAKINEVLPEPLWMRKMAEADRKGLKFQRGPKQ